MPEESVQQPRGWFVRRFDAKFKIRLAGAAGGVLLALLIAPATRRLFLAQVGLTVPVPATIASVGGSALGIHPDPFERDIAFRAARAVAARHPDDAQVQIANATLLDGDSGTSKDKITRLRALESRFADVPALYANILRYEAMGWVNPKHQVEQCVLTGTPVPTHPSRAERQPLDQAEYVAYDRDAAAGERLDPDNAYFPFMRAVGLFGINHDDEALAAIARAASRPQWREYYDEELKGQWRLQDEAAVNNSALFHSLSAAALLFPQYAQMRSAVRVTIYLAVRAEQTGHRAEGFAIRKEILQIGSLMRVQSRNLIGSLVGIGFTNLAIARPDGAAPIRETDGRKAQENRAKVRGQFDAYLQRIGHADEIDAFHTEQRAGEDVAELIRRGTENPMFSRPLQSLLLWWAIDLLTLSNILWLLVCGGIAALLLRNRRLQSGQALPPHARLAAPLGAIGGALAAPSLLTWLSPYFYNIADDVRIKMLLIGLVPCLLLLVQSAKTGHERRLRLGVYGGSLLAGCLLSGLYFWQLRGFTGIASLMQVCKNLSGYTAPRDTPDPIGAVPWSTACVPLLILLAASIVSRACRVPLAVGWARAFKGLMVPVAATLFLVYGGMMLCTVRAEAEVQYGLDRSLQNELQYIADRLSIPFDSTK